jgi:hypothetical protein
MKYVLFAILAAFLASCAPKAVAPPEKSVPPAKAFMEERFKSADAVEKVGIGATGTSFYYDRRLWSVKGGDGSRIDFNARRFTNAHILFYEEAIPMTEIHKKLVESYGLKDARLLESEFIRVNGEVVIFNKIEGKYGRKDVVMLSYGFSDAGHTVIAHGYTYKSMLREETEEEIVDFLNGFSPKG